MLGIISIQESEHQVARMVVMVARTFLAVWQKIADETGLHPEFANWIADSITNLDFHCAVVGPNPPDEQTFPVDPQSADLAMLICEDEDMMRAEALRHACDTWWKPFEVHVLKPLSDQIRDINKKIAALKGISDDPW